MFNLSHLYRSMDATNGKNSTMISADALPEVLRMSSAQGGSGRGMTFWAGASRCGPQAVLYELRQNEWDEHPELIPTFDPLKRVAFAVGSVYHKCHELWRRDELLSEIPATEDINVQLGVHLFEGWRSNWHRDLWGKLIALEQKIGVVVEGEQMDAKPDMVVYMDAERVRYVEQLRQVELDGPGHYIIDWKTAGMDYPVEYYTDGLQAYWYSTAWNMLYPEAPVKGMIFDVLKKPNARARDQSITLDNFSAVFAPTRDRDLVLNTLRGMILQGKENIARNLGNRSECHKLEFGEWKACPFFGRQCEGY